MFAPAYFDHNATTPLAEPVLAAMLPWLGGRFGNASSRHEYGRAARLAVDQARQQVAALVGAHPTEIIFTSGGSEANNLFLKGAAALMRPGLLGVSAIEHPCVLQPARQLRRAGWQLETLAVDVEGRVQAAEWAALVQQKPKLLSVMLANNETGVIQDIAGLAEIARRSGAWFHSDAVQAAGRIKVDFRELNRAGLAALSLSAHKLGGPKGAGALVVDKRVELQPLIAGGGQERDLRSGTENVAAIVGFGVAAEHAAAECAARQQALAQLRDRLEQGLHAAGARIFSTGAPRLANTSYFAFSGLDGETLVGKLDRAGFAVASGAACSSSKPEPSHVLQAMGVSEAEARGAVRVSLGAGNDATQIQEFLRVLQDTVAGLQGLTAIAV
ncbi:MAG: hypothetical protein RIR00_1524 [Pseudomonadota bacterium]|jgi:cysteine desulfurase